MNCHAQRYRRIGLRGYPSSPRPLHVHVVRRSSDRYPRKRLEATREDESCTAFGLLEEPVEDAFDKRDSLQPVIVVGADAARMPGVSNGSKTGHAERRRSPRAGRDDRRRLSSVAAVHEVETGTFDCSLLGSHDRRETCATQPRYVDITAASTPAAPISHCGFQILGSMPSRIAMNR